MNRRSFLKLFTAVTVAPTYFFAPVGGWKSDTIINPNEIVVDNDRMYFMSKEGIYENGLLISSPIDPELWGLPYWTTRPPYLSDTYMGIARSGAPNA